MTKGNNLGIFISVFMLLFIMCGCGKQAEQQIEQPTEIPTETVSEIVDSEETESMEAEKSILDELGTADQSYKCGDSSILNSYTGKSAEDYKELCSYFTSNGYEEYCLSEHNENLFATYVNGDALACIYWLKDKKELNVITSDTAGGNMPPAQPAVTDGNIQTTVVQLQQTIYDNGMGYVIRLADGSFLIFDVGHENMVSELYETLCELNGGEENIVIRAWMLTHSHEDHYGAMPVFFAQYADKVKLEYLLIAPAGPDEGFFGQARQKNFLKKFPDAKICIVHTGMIFQFCNLKMEILLTPEELLIDGIANNYNNTSIVSKVYSDDYSMLIMGDIAKEGGAVLSEIYGSYLKSDMCQVAHHGLDNLPLSLYELIEANILWYPCSRNKYETASLLDQRLEQKQQPTNLDRRLALERKSYTKEILLQDVERYQRDWGYISEADDNDYRYLIGDYGE